MDKIFYLSHHKFHQKNLEFIMKILLENDYAIDFIFNTMNFKIKTLIHRFNVNLEESQNNAMKIKLKLFSIPFVNGISNKFKNIINGMIHRISFSERFNLNNLKKFIKAHKGPLSNTLKRNIVYKIKCNDYDASYIGQTGN